MERVDLTHQYGVDRQRQWRDRATTAPNVRVVTFGRLQDGRWFAHLSGEPDGAHVFGADERGRDLALRLAYRWIRKAGGRWWPTPAAYDNRGEPVDGLPWVRRGGEWFLDGGNYTGVVRSSVSPAAGAGRSVAEVESVIEGALQTPGGYWRVEIVRYGPGQRWYRIIYAKTVVAE